MVKSTDPVQAARRAAIKREANRNRERRQQANDARALRQDTSSLERQIQRLQSRGAALDQQDQEELKRLQDEVANVNRIKEEYIRKHPDQRNFVRGYEEPSSNSDNQIVTTSTSIAVRNTTRNVPAAASQTTSRDPRWSIYYDAVFNPYGDPPPGMPYLEKPHAQLVQEGLLDAAKPPPLPEETEAQGLSLDDDSDDSSIDEDLKDIIMPSGPPPIRLLTETMPSSRPSTLLRSARGQGRGRGRGQAAMERRGFGSSRGSREPGSGSLHQANGGRQHAGFDQRAYARNPHSLPPRPPTGISMQPPAFASSTDASQSQASGASNPPGPPPAVPDGIVISAEPQLRDFKKESTAFVPAAIRKKRQEEKARMQRGLPGRVDAAPISNDMSDSSSASHKDRPDLLKSIRAHLPTKDVASLNQARQEAGSTGGEKDYDRFLDEIGDLL